MRRNHFLIARAVVNLQNDMLPIRIVNLSNEPVMFYKNTNLVTCERSIQIQENNGQSECKQPSSMPAHVENLFKVSRDCLNDAQRTILRGVVTEQPGFVRREQS